MKNKKTPDIRARELFKMVFREDSLFCEDPKCPFRCYEGWLKLGKFVLDLEKKWTKAKKGKQNDSK